MIKCSNTLIITATLLTALTSDALAKYHTIPWPPKEVYVKEYNCNNVKGFCDGQCMSVGPWCAKSMNHCTKIFTTACKKAGYKHQLSS